MKFPDKPLLVAAITGLLSVLVPTLCMHRSINTKQRLAAGVSSYMGDANKSRFVQSGLAGGVVFRYNLTFHWALKVNLLAGRVYGDTRESGSRFPAAGQTVFKRTFAEAGSQIEWNFLPYSDNYRYLGTRSYTPYLLVGAGLTYAPSEQDYVGLHIPFGVGLKVKLKNRLNVAVECSIRKLFADDFDVTHAPRRGWNLDQPYGIGSSHLKNQDWYSVTMICLTWDFGLRDDPCHGN